MAATTDVAILGLAAPRAGVCSRSELLAAGVPARTIAARVAAGFLVGTGPGLYELPALTTERTMLYRAVVAYPDGALSHLTAARLWDLPVPPGQPDDPIDVTRSRSASSRDRLSGITLHETRRWSSDDVATLDPGLRLTSPARTVMDVAGLVGRRRLRHIVQSAVTAGSATLDELSNQVRRSGGRGVAGSGRLRQVLAELDDGQPPAQSELEWRLCDLVDSRFQRQFRPPWYDGVRGVVDVADPDSRVIVEADGRRWHASEQAMVEDRRRDRAAAANGWLVLRVTWEDVTRRPEATATEIVAVVTRRCRPTAA